jgi:hypothetical protein
MENRLLCKNRLAYTIHYQIYVTACKQREMAIIITTIRYTVMEPSVDGLGLIDHK